MIRNQDNSQRRGFAAIRIRLAMLACLGVLLIQPIQAAFTAGPQDNAEASVGTPVPAEVVTQSGRSAIPRTPLEIIEALGIPFVCAFGVASVMALWFGIERLVQLRRRRVIPAHFVDRFLMHLRNGQLEPRQAMAICRDNGSPIADVFSHGVRKWGKPSVEVEQAIIDGGERQVSQLRKHLRVLNGVATVAPLIGLLGTVIGMIQAFNDIANSSAMGKPEELAVGIGLALLTTAVGLSIAIPALTLYMFLASRIDSLVMEMDKLSQNIVQLISQEALLAREQAATSGPRRRTKPRKQEETSEVS
ncbi:MAG: MotA/TolQ/ExbB proton channel family protein [Planctomycetaceae bacterium]